MLAGRAQGFEANFHSGQTMELQHHVMSPTIFFSIDLLFIVKEMSVNQWLNSC